MRFGLGDWGCRRASDPKNPFWRDGSTLPISSKTGLGLSWNAQSLSGERCAFPHLRSFGRSVELRVPVFFESGLVAGARNSSHPDPKKKPHEVAWFGAQEGIGFELECSKSFGLTLRVPPSALLWSLRRTAFSSLPEPKKSHARWLVFLVLRKGLGLS